MQNILFLLHFPPPVHGSSVVGKTIKNSSYINETFHCHYINLLGSKTVDDIGKLRLVKVFRLVKIYLKFLNTVLFNRPEICYLALTVTGFAFYKDVLLVATLRLFGIHRVYHMHNKGVSAKQTNKINNLLYQFVFKDADVILLSLHLYNDIKTFVPFSRVHICPNGIEDVQDKKLNSKSSSRSIQILFLSNLIQSKGVFMLLEACLLLKNKDIPFQCVFIGSEGDIRTSEFNEQVKLLKLEDNVSYLGKRYGVEKQEAITSADIFAFPTYYSNECFPLVLLEAMSASLPIVSTFEGGIPDIVDHEHTGFLVPQKNIEKLAEKLELLIKNTELRQQMGKAGRKKYEREFRLETFEHKLTNILKLIIEKNYAK